MPFTAPALKRHIKHFARNLGVDISLRKKRGEETLPGYVGDEFSALYKKYCDFSMVPWSGLYTAYKSVQYVHQNNIPGDIVECGVWKGGCAALMAETLMRLSDQSRKIYLYDTFQGMNAPEAVDRHFSGSQNATDKYNALRIRNKSWSHGPKEDVEHAVTMSGYPSDKIVMIEGPVEDTLKSIVPEHIAVLRLDTDWYQSTKAEMDALYPRLKKGGVLLCDDYGAWEGAYKAVNEYFEHHNLKPFLQIDPSFGGISMVKP